MIRTAGRVGVEGENLIRRGPQVVPADTFARVAFPVHRREIPAVVSEDPQRAGARPVQYNVVAVAAVVVVEGERTVGLGAQIVSRDAIAWVAFPVHGGKGAIVVLENPNRAGAGSIKDDVILLPAVVVVERKGQVVRRAEIVPAEAFAGVAFPVHRREVPAVISEDPERPCTRPVQRDVVQLAAVVVIESKPPVGRRAEIIPADAFAWVAFPVHRCEGSVRILLDDP